jgi:integrase
MGRLLAACRASENEDLYAFVITAVTTGARRGELLSLEWSNIDVDRRWAVFPKTKNGDARGVPLTEAVLAALRGLTRTGPLVFSGVDPTRAFRTAVRRAELQGVSLHTLRHSAASLLVRNNATLFEVSRLLGHRDVRVSDWYAHLASESTAALLTASWGVSNDTPQSPTGITIRRPS